MSNHVSNISDANYRTIKGFVSEDCEAGYVRHRSQDIDDSFLDNLRTKRIETANSRLPDMTLVASIPAIFVVKWMDEGFNIYREPLKAILKKLADENLGDFLATNRKMV